MTDLTIDWRNLWKKFNKHYDKYGYSTWENQKRMITKLVNEQLKEQQREYSDNANPPKQP